MIPVILVMFWIKNRSSVQCWVRPHHQPDRWLLAASLPSKCDPKIQHSKLQNIVEQARNCEWDASCAYRGYDPVSGDLIIGLISDKKPRNPDDHLEFTLVPRGLVLRASGQPRDEGVTVRSKVEQWCKANSVSTTAKVSSLSAQSFQCWEWPIEGSTPPPHFIKGLAEKVFEMRDIAFYPLIVTPLTIAMLGTGSSWLFGAGIFSIILLSGAHKFVFLHQREDATQERHLQNC